MEDNVTVKCIRNNHKYQDKVLGLTKLRIKVDSDEQGVTLYII